MKRAICLVVCLVILAASLACGGGGDSSTRTERCLAMPGSLTASCPSGSVPLRNCSPTGWGDTTIVSCLVGR